MRYLTLIFILLISNLTFADTIYVPEDYPTIQEAINSANDNDTIIISSGIYSENIDYLGKNLMIGSYFILEQDPNYIETTILDGSQEGRVVTAENVEGLNAGLNGLTIQNGSSDLGGGIYCSGSNFVLSNLIIINNQSTNRGGGIHCSNSNIQIFNCMFESNTAQNNGGGLFCITSNLEVINCEFLDNFSGVNGGGLQSHFSTITISDCLFYDNLANDNGGGIFLGHSDGFVNNCILYNNISLGGMSAIDMWSGVTTIHDCTVTQNQSPNWGTVGFWDSATVDIVNTIISNNQGYALYGHPESITDISYCDIYSNTEGSFGGSFIQGSLGDIQEQNSNGDPCDPYFNIYMDPNFTDPVYYDFHLAANSPCINAGSPLLPADPDETISDIGASYFDQEYPYANFLTDVTCGVVPLVVNFNDVSYAGSSGDPIIEWMWDFNNDGSVDSYEQNPSYTYTDAGIFTVVLTVSDGEYSNTKTKTDYVTVFDPILTEFDATPTQGFFPLEIQFTDLSIGLPESWQWDFNNDGIIDTYVQNPIFVYNLPGIYSVALTVSDGTYIDTEIKEEFIVVLEPLIAEFEGFPTDGQVPLEVQFTDQSFGNPTLWLWDFNNDGFVESNAQNPIYTFTQVGLYSVSLTVSDGIDIVTETKVDYINVSPTNADTDIIPLQTKLFNNYPNPFNPSTTIRYDLHEHADVIVQILNNKGQIVKTLVKQHIQPGNYSIIWNGINESGDQVSSGIYLYKMIVNGRTEEVKKCVLLK
jgi:predicted outer membrane repeat protein